MNKCFQLRRVKLLSFHKKSSEIKRKFTYFAKKNFSFKTQFSTKKPRNKKYFRIFSKKEFLFKYEIVQYSLLLLYRYYHYKDGTSRSVQSFQRASKGVLQRPDHLSNSLVKGGKFHSSEFIL